METARAALRQLVEGDTTIINSVPCEREPLIAILRGMRYPSIGKGSGSGGGEGHMLNTAAIDLYEHIDGVTRSALNEWRYDTTGNLETVLSRMFDAISVEQAAWMTPEDAERMYFRFVQWQQQIEELIDPPHVKELAGACPACDATHHEVDGVQNIALFAKIKPGIAVVPECRACGAIWAGEEQLKELGHAIGAEIDFVALRELAVNSAQTGDVVG